jgi:hypothetical protein
MKWRGDGGYRCEWKIDGMQREGGGIERKSGKIPDEEVGIKWISEGGGGSKILRSLPR